jgi:hypothetical protein
MRLRAGLDRNHNLRLVIMTAGTALAGFHDDSLRPAPAHVLAHGALRQPGWLQRQGLLA